MHERATTHGGHEVAGRPGRRVWQVEGDLLEGVLLTSFSAQELLATAEGLVPDGERDRVAVGRALRAAAAADSPWARRLERLLDARHARALADAARLDGTRLRRVFAVRPTWRIADLGGWVWALAVRDDADAAVLRPEVTAALAFDAWALLGDLAAAAGTQRAASGRLAPTG